MNYYETLNISRNASQEEIKQAYRKLAKEYHPDKNPGKDTSLKFQQIQEAYETLGDQDKRNQYDGGGSSIEDLLRNWGFNGSNFSQDFDMHFGGFRNNPNARGQDIRISIPITLQEIFEGTKRRINLGSESIDVNIPKGARDGSKYKIAGKGQPNPYNSLAPKGDLIITINLIYDTDFIIQGDDIFTETFIKFYDAILGTSINVDTPTGKISIKIPQYTSSGKILRVAGKGLPISGTDHCGALLIKINVNFHKLSEDQISLINRVREIDA